MPCGEIAVDAVRQPSGNWRRDRVSKRVVSQGIYIILTEFSRRRHGPARREAHNAFAFFRREPPDMAPLRILDVGPAPIGSGVAGRACVEAVGDGLEDGAIAANISNACLKGGKSGLPI